MDMKTSGRSAVKNPRVLTRTSPWDGKDSTNGNLPVDLYKVYALAEAFRHLSEELGRATDQWECWAAKLGVDVPDDDEEQNGAIEEAARVFYGRYLVLNQYIGSISAPLYDASLA